MSLPTKIFFHHLNSHGPETLFSRVGRNVMARSLSDDSPMKETAVLAESAGSLSAL